MSRRCAWAEGDPLLAAYHDSEWGVPSFDDRHLFELLTLEGAQAGLSWLTILRKREGYRRAFAEFDPVRVARFTPSKVDRLLEDPGVVRHRGKLESVVSNARALLRVQKELGSFAAGIWGIVGNRPRENAWRSLGEIPAETEESRRLSRELARKGFRFVGPTTCYAFMQAVGMVNDHLVGCSRRGAIEELGRHTIAEAGVRRSRARGSVELSSRPRRSPPAADRDTRAGPKPAPGSGHPPRRAGR